MEEKGKVEKKEEKGRELERWSGGVVEWFSLCFGPCSYGAGGAVLDGHISTGHASRGLKELFF